MSLPTIFQPTIKLASFTSGGVTYFDSYLDNNGNIAIVSDVYSVAQTVQTSIQMWQGEYQFDTTVGIPWGQILGVPANRLLLNSFIQTAVLAVAYVTDIISIDYTIDNQNRVTTVTVKYNNVDSSVGTANANF